MISFCVKAYWLVPLGVATTIPAPGTGSGWIYFVSTLCAGGAANARRTVHGKLRAALAAAPHLRNDRLVIMAPSTLTKPKRNVFTDFVKHFPFLARQYTYPTLRWLRLAPRARLFEVARVLVPLDHVASVIVNVNHRIIFRLNLARPRRAAPQCGTASPRG
jgi:hypothetical protein